MDTYCILKKVHSIIFKKHLLLEIFISYCWPFILQLFGTVFCLAEKKIWQSLAAFIINKQQLVGSVA